jgi:hypothetical protein
MLWLATLFSPAFIILQAYSVIVVLAPLWMLGVDGTDGFFVFLGFNAQVPGWTVHCQSDRVEHRSLALPGNGTGLTP